VSDFQWRRDAVEGVFTPFNRRMLLGGELYRASNENPVEVSLRLFGDDGRAQLRFEGGGLSGTRTAQIRVSLASLINGKGFIEATGDIPDLKFKLQSSTGRYSGSFTHPDTKEKTKFEGVMRRRSDDVDPRMGAGTFQSRDGNTGAVTVRPLGS
jgi:hypothetical protein